MVRRTLTKSKFADFGVPAAHHAGHGNRPLDIGDHQVFRCQPAFLTVERDKDLAVAGRPHNDRRRLAASALDEQIVVEGVQRLAPFEHDEVGDVDDVADRPHAGVQQPALHPARCQANRDVLDERRRITSAERRVVDADSNLSVDRLSGGLHPRGRQLERLPGDRRHLAGHADHRQTTCHIRQHIDFEHDVAHEIGQGRADRRVGFQEDDALVLLGDTELQQRADHRIGRDAANLGGFQLG
jgi:hypothetical protein